VRQPVATPPRDARGPTPAGVPQGLGAFMVGGVELSGGRVAWHDQRAKTRYAFDDLEVHTGAIAPVWPSRSGSGRAWSPRDQP